ncbi:growth arrest-specific protein 2-like [Daktulosphaira vitifoliae]|uniref:growth arrest-specific protein 2-like n=1 Tax=Daktulosphaira vitifoliae TaxID=58002 RepID=UPI0021A99F7E|nr:growth arrest-specific protein 2-like [Daktulosphaira vitifoliae]
MNANPKNFVNHKISSANTDQEYLEQYQCKITDYQKRNLLPLQEDLADWINKSLGIDWLNVNNLLDMLDNGVVLCRLGKTIEHFAREYILTENYQGDLPTISSRCFESARKHSFFSRDNTEKFIQFCRRLGVHQHLLFESDDLVLQNNPRNVVLCLMEVSRLASRFGLEPPGLVQMEKEIDAEEARSHQINHYVSPTYSTPNNNHHRCSISAIPMAIKSTNKLRRTESLGTASMITLRSESDTTDEDYVIDGSQHLNELDYKVKEASRIAHTHCHCQGKKLKLKKIGEGRYSIYGRNVFIRLLKGTHMMVRVGGGWDTLENFLLRHDPCQTPGKSNVRTSPLCNRTVSPAPPNNSRVQSPSQRRSSIPRYLGPKFNSSNAFKTLPETTLLAR